MALSSRPQQLQSRTKKFNGWINYVDNDTKSGKLVLTGRKGQPNLTFRTTGTNDL